MELKRGYKNTEIGVIPKDWKVISFDNAFYFLSTASYSRAELSKNDEIKYVHYGDIHTKLNYVLDFKAFALPTINNIQLKTYNLIKEGDLIMADASEDYDGIGKGVEVKNVGNEKAISGLHTFLLRGKEGVFSNNFKAYLHSNIIVKSQYDKLATGLKVYGVSKANLKQILIPLPPLPEQTAIAAVLSDTDSLIQALEKKIAKKQLIKKGAMQKLLTPKEGWEVKSFNQVFIKHPSKNYQINSSEYNTYGLHPIIDQGKKLIVGYSDNKGKLFKCPDGGLIIFGDHTRILKFVDFDFIVGADGTQLISVQNSFNTLFIYHLLSTKEIPNTGYNRHFKLLLEMELLIPVSKKEQTHIATILSNMDSQIESLQKKLDKYKQVKVGMMQNLLTGKIRLI